MHTLTHSHIHTHAQPYLSIPHTEQKHKLHKHTYTYTHTTHTLSSAINSGVSVVCISVLELASQLAQVKKLLS